MKIIKLGSDARQALKRGIDAVADCVKITLGPSGRNVIVGKEYGTPLITNDGVSIAQQVICEDEIEELGAQMVKEVSRITDQKAGDGTTTATVLLQAITNEGFKRIDNTKSLVQSQVDTMEIKREIDTACEKVIKELDKVTRKVSTREDIYHVAKVSVESDTLAEIVTDLYEKVGKDGTVLVEDGYLEIESEVFSGLEIEATFLTPRISEKNLTIKSPHILVTNHVFSDSTKLIPIIEELAKKGARELVIIAEDFSKELLQMFNYNHANGQFTIVAIKAPFFGKAELYEDISTLTGGTFVDRNIKDSIEFSDLGKSEQVVIKDKTWIIGGKGNTKDRVKDLKKELKTTISLFDKAKLEKRIAGLGGGIGVIRVGATSDSEREYLKLKVEDAVNAVKYALQDGVVKGGGVTLKQIAEKLPKSILTEALKAPYEQIQKNSGGLKVGDNIIDPVKTTKSALQNACSIAGVLLTTEVAIAHKHDTKDESKD